MTHGDHWAAIDPDHERLIEEMLSIVGTKGEIVGRSNTVVGDGERRWVSEVVGLRYPTDPLGFLLLVVARDGRREMWSAYPHAEGRRKSTLRVEAVELEGNGIEAVIHVSMPDAGGFSISDPLYFLDKDHLRVGEEATLRLSAVAYGIRKCEQTLFLTRGSLFEMLRDEFLEAHPGKDPSEVDSMPLSLAGTACLFPRDDADAEVMFRIDDILSFDCGRPVTRMSGVVMRSDDQELGIDVYASASALDGYVPQVGDQIQAVVWMQGVLDR